MKLWIIIALIGFNSVLNAQEVINDGKRYEVKKGKIFHEGTDVTASLSVEERNNIFIQYERVSEDLKLKEKLEKEARKAEKAQNKAEKKQKQAEKALRKREKAQDNYDKAVKKLEQAQNKFEKLKRKGKLSPKEEAKWFEKLDNLTQSSEKAKKKLKRS
ncbi:hypothetical protein ACFO5O_12395 [Geojedonia litorea]|uniref:Uncharacterized protein n=1 Tax=Geojedonia litorea TaxID=1268269 RepID=A0ABV9N469_9FLAO